MSTGDFPPKPRKNTQSGSTGRGGGGGSWINTSEDLPKLPRDSLKRKKIQESDIFSRKNVAFFGQAR